MYPTQAHGLTDNQATTLIQNVRQTVETTMSKEPFDPSHDFHHVERVLSMAETLAASERLLHRDLALDPLLITLTALLHDIGDAKYVLPPSQAYIETVQTILQIHGAPEALISTVQCLAANISFSHEKHPAQVQNLIAQHPELAIVQDADRLDALGAMGVTRAFVFNCVRGERLEEARHVFDTRLLPREGLMKTALGRKLAKERCDFLRVFMARWDLEMGVRKNAREGCFNFWACPNFSGASSSIQYIRVSL